jgi:hypothetical protein
LRCSAAWRSSAACLAVLVALLAYPNLPSLDVLTDYQPKIPLRVYTAEGALIGEFGEERRSVISIRDIPAQLKDAILAAEDERFYQHTGIDYLGVLRAAYANLTQGGRRQGASTITMQVARNFFLTTEKTLTRKLYEALLLVQDRAQPQQGPDPRAVRKSDLSRPARVRIRGRLAGLLRQIREATDAGGVRDAGRACQKRLLRTTLLQIRNARSCASSTCCAA